MVFRGSAEVPEVKGAPLVAEEEIINTVFPLWYLGSWENQELIKFQMVYKINT